MRRGPIGALDVGYAPGRTLAAAAALPDWSSPAGEATHLVVSLLGPPAEYRSGAFFERELPPLLSLLSDPARLDELLSGARLEDAAALLVDGHAWLAPDRPGLGARLHQALGERVPVVGVAKGAWRGSPHAVQVRRGGSRRPLFVTAAGVEAAEAAERVRSLAGAHRLPDLLRQVDALSRGRP